MNMKKFKNIAVYGGGSWGLALACQVARCYDNASVFLRDNNVVKEIIEKRTNIKYLGTDIKLPNNIIPSSNLSNILDKEVIIIAVPSFAFLDVLGILKNAEISENVVLLVATKGFGKNPTELLSDKARLILPNNPLAFVAGPNLAKEVVRDLLTTATIASVDIELAKRLALSLTSERFKVDISNQIVTMQVAGAVKNIIAIKSGWYDAKNYGQNAKAGLITGGIEEIQTISEALGGSLGDNSILFAPGVLGDLVLTCYSRESRNTKFGYELGMCDDNDRFLNECDYLVEGREATKLVLDIIKKHTITLPLILSVAKKLKLL
jgi:glycerol-3-phosphate dehydrogenase (NAD(P)+)